MRSVISVASKDTGFVPSLTHFIEVEQPGYKEISGRHPRILNQNYFVMSSTNEVMIPERMALVQLHLSFPQKIHINPCYLNGLSYTSLRIFITKEPTMPDSNVRGEEKPPSRRIKRFWKIAVLANIKDDTHPKPEGVPPDAFADFDHIETIDALRAALETDGHETVFIQADMDLPYALKDAKPDICFNIAEGLGGDAREAQVPALLEMLQIPYTGSRVLTNGISLDKTLTKRIWRDRRLPVAPFQEFIIGDESLRPELNFPLFVKPAREGTGMGVDTKAIVKNEKELRERSSYIINTYQQPALVETFLPGREFTVGVLGRLDAKLYSRNPEWYEKDGFHRFPILELDMTRSVTPSQKQWAAVKTMFDAMTVPVHRPPLPRSATVSG